MSSTSARATLGQSMRERALADLQARRASAPARIANDELPAGQPMYYYCRCCGWVCDIMPEHWFLGQPRTLCTECYAMQLRDWLPDD